MKAETLAMLGGSKTIASAGPHYVWPKITMSMEHAVIEQLHTSLSIYDRSGVFKDFETEFATYHGRKYALLSNSGTNAIYSMFEGVAIEPGDEVICPVYTFFATVSPLMHTGAIPVFCDCGDDGNINPAEIEKRITSRTKAIIITHMWGIPCEMDAIMNICKQYNLRLLEDCSHAHGARYGDKIVGSFGDATAWSLQGQKIVTGGEGGIMLTDNEEIYYRALLQGHYNKRCKQEIPPQHPLGRFSTTGFGLKFRAHPLAVTIMQEQFSHLDEWLKQKQLYAEQMTKAFKQFPFLRIPKFDRKRPSWYAYVIQFDSSYSNRVNIDLFTQLVLAEGLIEIDRPRSTSPLHFLPLFIEPNEALPRLYSQTLEINSCSFPNAERFYDNALKLPVWAFPDDQYIVDLYIEGIVKVASVIIDNPKPLIDMQIFK